MLIFYLEALDDSFRTYPKFSTKYALARVDISKKGKNIVDIEQVNILTEKSLVASLSLFGTRGDEIS